MRNRLREGCLLIAPLVFTLAGSALEKYPFGLRFTLFYGPYVLLLVAAGAAAIALGTALFSDPEAPGRVRRELAEELAARGLSEPGDATGLAHASGTITVA